VKQVFRLRDGDSMHFAFDPWSEDDVGEHAEATLSLGSKARPSALERIEEERCQ
jgi:hypothetical protein